MKKNVYSQEGIALGLAAVMLGRVFRLRHQYQPGAAQTQAPQVRPQKTQASQGQEQTTIEMWYHISPDQAKRFLLQMIDEFQETASRHQGGNPERGFRGNQENSCPLAWAADQLPDVYAL